MKKSSFLISIFFLLNVSMVNPQDIYTRSITPVPISIDSPIVRILPNMRDSLNIANKKLTSTVNEGKTISKDIKKQLNTMMGQADTIEGLVNNKNINNTKKGKDIAPIRRGWFYNLLHRKNK